ncbi:type I CRISPR-associated protein Cas8a1/Csx8 [Clostridium sp. NSJ-145]|uniref:type I CRISPR-associated protein Cas8a1/Csx8 n=1 Tax=Clostridium sp. NSJ-145 TaxID=2897777 RepID=UPI001E59C415|nr:type I CRISPR-associated protein Cas8a1/Csx8 [Clostridium sp. NSJ-145]MCD2503223.1 type I CRISPR-associated protein Cas8a1/Csx8 [Clostridium sp. NSJ-145]MDY3359769.1 type I CRISPR-associated protein Cas8a1/Csx8 [Clostridium celatum]
MKSSIQHNKHNTKLESSDWRFSAAILGLYKYLSHFNLDYEIGDDYILYNSEDVNEERFLKFIEYHYGEEFHHKIIENILTNDEISDEQVKVVNDKLSANIVMKKVFTKIKFDKTNKEEIRSIINKNRDEIIRETFRSKKNMYANYANTNQLFNAEQEYCRLLGYCIDVGKKGKSTGYNFNISTFVGNDIIEFDFIPIAFQGSREVFFINDNYTIKRLISTNEMFRKKVLDEIGSNNGRVDSRQALFKGITETAEFIERDVEIIFKDMNNGYFETLYLRKDCIDVFKNLLNNNVDYKSFCFSYKVTDKYYRNIQKEVTDCIINKIFLDDLIELFLKNNNGYLVSQFIKINVLMRGDNSMNDTLKGAFACAKQVSEKLEKNKIESYRQKLTSSIIFKDYDRVCQILLQLSNYSGIEFKFVYPLFDDFENNKELAYTFINALSKNSNNKLQNSNENN